MKNSHMLRICLLLLSWCTSNYSHAQVIEETNPGTAHGNTGTLKFTYSGNQVTYATVRAKDGNVWLQQNVGSANVAANRTDNASWGDLFQWGRWDDGHQFRMSAKSNTVLSPNNPTGLGTGSALFYHDATSRWWVSGTNTDKVEAVSPSEVSADNGCDPCKKLLGGQWRLPTSTEWEAVRVAENISDYTTAFNSNLKIPSITFRDGSTGDLNTNTNTTRLWSSTAGVSGGAYVFHLVSNNATTTSNISRGNGYAIRCIKAPITTTPVGFINFKGKIGLTGVGLEWVVASETNNDFYTIKHSQDGIAFKDLITSKGKGNTSTKQTYNYLHKRPFVGENYYKLLQTDFDGTERELSTIVLINSIVESGKITISTTENTVKIVPVSYDKKLKKITILTISGETVYAAKINNNNLVFPIALKKGAYVAQIEFDNNTSKAVKFLR